MTPDHARIARAIHRLEQILEGQVKLLRRIEEALAGIAAEDRPANGEAALAAATAERDKTQDKLDRLYRTTTVTPDMPHPWLYGVLNARLKRQSQLDWITMVSRLGGPAPRVLLARVRDLGREGAAPMGPDCPVVKGLMLQDEARPRPRGRGLERDTDVVAPLIRDARRPGPEPRSASSTTPPDTARVGSKHVCGSGFGSGSPGRAPLTRRF